MQVTLEYIAKLQKSAYLYLAVTGCICFFALNLASAQSIVQADNYYSAQQYYKASQLYQKIVSGDSSHYQAAYQLAHCYRYLYKYQRAEKYYGDVAQNAGRNFPLAPYYYAQMLKYNQRYEDALFWYNQFLKNYADKSSKFVIQAEKEKEGCVQAILSQPEGNDKVKLNRLSEDVNTVDYQEFAPALYQHDSIIAYSSTRIDSHDNISNRSGEAFSNQYLVKKDSQAWKDISRETRFSQLNTKWSDANGSFTADGMYYYFTRCSPTTDGFCHIYVTTQKNGKWQEARLLGEDINAPNSNTKHPSISANGDTLFFVSDRAGGLGGTDIWMSRRVEGEWKAAVNLGNDTNTVDDEISPFYSTKHKLLIFASDGRSGIGGMDLYMAEINQATPETPVPLASPFNSSKDDCYLVLGENVAYMASNREGSFDIYSVHKQEKQSFFRLLQGIHADQLVKQQKEGEVFEDIITDYSVLMSQKEENITVMHSSGQDFLRNGSSRFVLSADVNDILLEQLRDKKALTEGTTYTPTAENSADTLSENNLLVSFSTFQISSDEMVEISGSVSYRNQENTPVAKLSLYLLDEEGNITKITTTNAQGEFRFVNLEAEAAYEIRYSETLEAQQPNYKLENLRVFGYGNDFVTLHFENIYFDFNQSYLRNEAKVALDQLAAFHERYPESVIEINAFTDSTGNDVYNLQLSRERGQSAFNYLLEQGVDRSALVFNAKGVSTAIESSNSFISQQLNRRVEFYVLGKDLKFEQEVVTRMLRPKITLYTLANETGMSLEEIKRLNGLNGNELQAYKPIRIYRWAYEQAQGLFYQMQLRSE
ncbi:outer membrane protein OmpA-like peptidoglycan-associated protein [Catalinimonas alkaloidigena]|uniref:OmpA family protein n=1 Tax=Catalinimonas alkaloidigena TaxID=1075417 RepID=UPI002406E9C8|nr:OmpA family protein [Catalinimonas alkaloidigena]MDF9795315.1 outer membrane protein OmpA-like peptidoglycan-associated protein [Catalinimonas alkaloidigena]